MTTQFTLKLLWPYLLLGACFWFSSKSPKLRGIPFQNRFFFSFTPAGMLPRNRPGHKGVGHWRNGDAKGQQAHAIGPATPRGALVSALRIGDDLITY
jgi:hypothetical protein